jgi:hypothetical protein
VRANIEIGRADGQPPVIHDPVVRVYIKGIVAVAYERAQRPTRGLVAFAAGRIMADVAGLGCGAATGLDRERGDSYCSHATLVSI